MTSNHRQTEQASDAARNGQLKTPVEARQGVKTRRVRWVLAISLTLGVVALGGAYIWSASSPQSHSASPSTAADQRPSNG